MNRKIWLIQAKEYIDGTARLCICAGLTTKFLAEKYCSLAEAFEKRLAAAWMAALRKYNTDVVEYFESEAARRAFLNPYDPEGTYERHYLRNYTELCERFHKNRGVPRFSVVAQTLLTRDDERPWHLPGFADAVTAHYRAEQKRLKPKGLKTDDNIPF